MKYEQNEYFNIVNQLPRLPDCVFAKKIFSSNKRTKVEKEKQIEVIAIDDCNQNYENIIYI